MPLIRPGPARDTNGKIKKKGGKGGPIPWHTSSSRERAHLRATTWKVQNLSSLTNLTGLIENEKPHNRKAKGRRRRRIWIPKLRVGILTKALRQCPARHFESLQPERPEKDNLKGNCQVLRHFPKAIPKTTHTYECVSVCVCLFWFSVFLSNRWEFMLLFLLDGSPLYDLPATRSAICQIV